ncbi:MAG TPA: hypothetical protein VL371_24985, partial [Gemmataceae bacterium]|nr:hypothetical protein [Gemmataceae bacterium]
LMDGPPSDWLEAYRKVNTELRRRDLAERDGLLVKAEVIRQALRSGVSAMRSTGDRLVRLFGNEAGEIYNEGVTEFETAALRTANDEVRGNPDPQLGGVAEDAPASDA